MKQSAKATSRLSKEAFVVKAITALRTQGYEGAHSVFSGFNEALRKYYPNEDPVQITTELASKGIIHVQPCRKGVMLYIGPSQKRGKVEHDRGADILAKMGL